MEIVLEEHFLCCFSCASIWEHESFLGWLSGVDLGRMANLKLVDKRVKELVELKLQVLVEVRTSSG
jgi:hypothetical protein